MDIDKLFKAPKLPAGGNKRRMPDNPSPEMLKKMKVESVAPTSSAPVAQNKGKGRAVTVTDEDEEMEDGSGFAPGGDADYFAEEDQDGRFFGGGLSEQEKQVMNILDKHMGESAQDEETQELNITAIRRMLLKFERAMNKNQDQRSKYPNDPSKFMDSEADLDVAIKELLPLAQEPTLGYSELVRSGAVVNLIGLMSHENADIVIDVVEVIHELTDDDVGDEAEGAEDNDDDPLAPKGNESLKLLVDALMENQIFELLVQNLGRFNEEDESDRMGVFHTLGIFENVLGYNPSLARELVSKTRIMPWLLSRIKAKTWDDNRGYASEMLAILLQENRENRLELGKQNGIDILLQVLSQYRRRDPAEGDEAEFMENVFDTLCSALAEPEIKKLFLESEGVELMVILMKEKMAARSRSIKVLDHSMSGPAGSANCETFVEALGLKTLFSALMGKGKKQKASSIASPASEDTSHILGIISSLLSNLASDSAPRVRLLSKFVEEDYEKVDRILEIREHAQGRLDAVEKGVVIERKELLADGEEVGLDEEDTWYLRRLDGGLFTLQTVDYILGWLCMEDDGARNHVQRLLGRKGKPLKDIVRVLQEYHDNVADETPSEQTEPSSTPPQKMILQGLIDFLEGC